MTKRRDGDGTSFHVSFPATQLSPAQVSRLSEAIQRAVLEEIARIDLKDDLAVALVKNGKTGGGKPVRLDLVFPNWALLALEDPPAKPPPHGRLHGMVLPSWPGDDDTVPFLPGHGAPLPKGDK